MPDPREPLSGLWNRRGDPMLDGAIRFPDVIDLVRDNRPCSGRIGPLGVCGDDLNLVLPPTDTAPKLSAELLRRLVETLDAGGCVWVFATHDQAIAGVRRQMKAADARLGLARSERGTVTPVNPLEAACA